MISPDGKYFFFTSFRDKQLYKFKQPVLTADYLEILSSPLNGLGNIFWVETKEILKPD